MVKKGMMKLVSNKGNQWKMDVASPGKRLDGKSDP